MKYIDEFRDPALARTLLARIAARVTRPVRLMEFCGGHTHAILRYGLRSLLPETVDLRSGPGCPVCVTANADLDRAIALAQVPGLILTTFGDMIRVPGSRQSLQEAKAGGADVRIVYSTLDALRIARDNPARPVVFLGVGFETTAPTVAAAILQAEREGLANFSVLSLHKLTPPATRAILDAGEVALHGIIGPGHVTTIIGSDAWEFLPGEYGVPVAIAGFEPVDILRAVADLVEMVEAGRPAVANSYCRSVTRPGQPDGAGGDGPRVRGRRRRVAGPGAGAGQRPGHSRRVRRHGRCSPVRGGAGPDARAPRLPVRRRAARHGRSARVPALWPGLHPGPAGRPVHGLGRGGVCGLLPVRAGCGMTGGVILLAHGSGGKLSHDLVERSSCATSPTLPYFSSTTRPSCTSIPTGISESPASRLQPPSLAFTTDSYVVSPLFFPGGDIGKLAVCGTVNDLSMSGARPLWLSAGFIVEEGLPLADLERIVASMAATAEQAGVQIVTGDTKVVDRGSADRLFINTAGVGLLEPGVEIGGDRARPGDVVLLSGTIGDHGMTIMTQREGLAVRQPAG